MFQAMIASGIVERPLGTITYEVGSSRDLFNVLETLLNNFRETKCQDEVVDYKKFTNKYTVNVRNSWIYRL